MTRIWRGGPDCPSEIGRRRVRARPRLLWIAMALLFMHLGCIRRSVPVTPSGVPVDVSAAERTACEELARAEEDAAITAARPKPPPTAGEIAGMLFSLPWIVLALPAMPI